MYEGIFHYSPIPLLVEACCIYALVVVCLSLTVGTHIFQLNQVGATFSTFRVQFLAQCLLGLPDPLDRLLECLITESRSEAGKGR
ncbi:unnamed protein product [Acanthoscelides obtectus]|uniref:Uncharacterized protein n=1 Tax=Acanthoscelides obtectus TaxID=200917 RepID=A0A9P0LCX5_ACAOB|nr:unnamed protein product [Acanthoscelides obtectus]CAK1674505.1 hypothetical protein AOBTE_LOCUS29641 [Acanthoscelides obtectus]